MHMAFYPCYMDSYASLTTVLTIRDSGLSPLEETKSQILHRLYGRALTLILLLINVTVLMPTNSYRHNVNDFHCRIQY